MGWEADLAERLSRAVNGEKNRIIAEYQQLTGKKPATLYRIAGNHGFKPDRASRKDKGMLKSELTDEQVNFVSTLIQTSAREVKGCIMPVCKALEIAEDNGVIAPGRISVARLTAILREREQNAAALDSVDPSIRMASLHPNHVHVFDASVCIQYYLKKGKGIRMMDERDFREKKPENFAKVKQRIIRMILVDHFSGFIFPRYYVAAGENQAITFDFLTSAWRGGLHEKLPFRGVPFFMLMDAGSANIAKGLLNFFDRLTIEIPKNMPHNPKRQGSAEVTQNIVERHFESGLRFEPATTVDELNEWAIDWAVRYNTQKVHSRLQMPRTAAWLSILPAQLRELPSDELCRMLYAEPEVERTVKQDNTISFNSQNYRLKHIPGIRPGKKVMVVLRPYDWPKVGIIYNAQEYLVEPIGTLAGGFSADSAIIGQEYKAQPQTPVQQVRKTNENLAYGEDRKRDSLPFGGTLRIMGHQAEKLDNVAMMPRKGTPLEVDRSAEAVQVPIMKLFRRLSDAGIAVTPAMNTELRERYGTTIDLRECDRLVAAYVAGEVSAAADSRPAGPLRLVSGA